MTDPKVEISLAGVWTDITAYTASVRSQLKVTRGKQDEQTKPGPSQCTFALNNRDGRFSRGNAAGPYYGQIGRNTPVRVSVPGRGYRFHGEISAWPPTWDQSGQDAWTTVTASGIMRRLGQGSPPLAGPITRYVAAPTIAPLLSAYWPLTDAPGSTAMASGLAGGSPMAIEGASQPRLAASSDFPSSSPVPVMNGGTFTGVPAVPFSGAAYFHFLVSTPGAGDTTDAVLLRVLGTGTAFRWELRYFVTGLVLRAFDGLGTSLLTSPSGADIDGTPILVRLGMVQGGSNINWFLVTVNYATEALIDVLSGTIVGQTMGSVSLVQVNADRALLNTAVGQIMLTTADPGYPAVANAYRGYAGETAGNRVARLCVEENVPLTTVGTLANTEPMGIQTAGGLLDLLTACEASDMGQLYEPRDAFGLAYRTRESMYGQAVDLALTYGQITGISPTEDDQQTRNDVIVTREFGSSARSTLTSGALSVQSPPNGVGRYQDAITLSLASDAQLQAQADWRVAVGTIDEPRYPVIATELQNTVNPNTSAVAVDIGDLITVTGTPIWIPPGGVSAHVLGYTEVFTPHSWEIEYNCVPSTPLDDIFTLDSATDGRLDATTSVTNGALTTSATNVPHTGETWTTTPGDFPFDIVIGGERMRVTANSGTAFTVTRSVNGVVKSHLTAQPIRLAEPAYLAL